LENNIFCKGYLCHKTDRKNKCTGCGKYICGVCTFKMLKKPYCIDCYLDKAVDIASDKLGNGFEMLLETNKAEFIKDEKNI
jgi:hypothetical protein